MKKPKGKIVNLEDYRALKVFVDEQNCPTKLDNIRRYSLKEFRRVIAPLLRKIGKDEAFINELAGAYALIYTSRRIKPKEEVFDELKRS